MPKGCCERESEVNLWVRSNDLNKDASNNNLDLGWGDGDSSGFGGGETPKSQAFRL
jgi:hypothetical protein